METASNSSIYTNLKQIITTLPDRGNLRIYRQLLEAVGAALLRGENPGKLARRIGRKRISKTICLVALSIGEAEKDMQEIKQLRKLAKARPLVPGARKLERYHAAIITLRRLKAAYRDIQLWLLAKKGLEVSHHSVQRYLKAVLKQE
jgi:hypothetical protein